MIHERAELAPGFERCGADFCLFALWLRQHFIQVSQSLFFCAVWLMPLQNQMGKCMIEDCFWSVVVTSQCSAAEREVLKTCLPFKSPDRVPIRPCHAETP